MSRVRTRPTRGETRRQLFRAAAKLFEERGIGATSIDAIVGEAGFTRGAFYSNFATKDDLIIGMLEAHAELSLAHYRDLLAEHREPQDLLSAMRTAERAHDDPLGRAPLLHLELILFMARQGTKRTELARRLAARRTLISEMIDATYGSEKIDSAWAGDLLVALEDGFRLHRLIDRSTTPADSFDQSVEILDSLIRPISRGPATTS
ncbi:TetR family transcriptional regulator [Sphingomonas sp. CL5.1]|nr:TetR family transcriptional regulator [Sphingomonas sp. CL5.1]